jgi:hypothetical protein
MYREVGMALFAAGHLPPPKKPHVGRTNVPRDLLGSDRKNDEPETQPPRNRALSLFLHFQEGVQRTGTIL